MNTHKIRQLAVVPKEMNSFLEILVVMEDGSFWSYIPDNNATGHKPWLRLELPHRENTHGSDA